MVCGHEELSWCLMKNPLDGSQIRHNGHVSSNKGLRMEQRAEQEHITILPYLSVRFHIFTLTTTQRHCRESLNTTSI